MVIADRRLAPSKQSDYKTFNSIRNTVDVPNLVQVQVNSFDWLKTDGLKDLFDEISPIEDFSGGRFDLRFLNHEIRNPKNTERECRKREITYSAPLYVTVQLVIKETGEVKEQVLFFGDVPMMTQNGTDNFILQSQAPMTFGQYSLAIHPHLRIQSKKKSEKQNY